jgi:phage antirepressor YoqD-like protein
MDREMIESIPEYSNLIKFLREHEAIWEVLGGSPQRYVDPSNFKVKETKLSYCPNC